MVLIVSLSVQCERCDAAASSFLFLAFCLISLCNETKETC